MVDSLMAAMQGKLLEQRLHEADSLLAALQQRYIEISGNALADPAGDKVAAKIVAGAANCRARAAGN